MTENRSDRRQELLDEVRSKANSLRLVVKDYLDEGFPSQDARLEASSVLRQVGMVVVDRGLLANFICSTLGYVRERDPCAKSSIETSFR